MKRFFAIVTAVILVFALCACGLEFGNYPDIGGKLGGVEIPNPVVSSDAKGVENVLGIPLDPPAGADGIRYSIIDEDLGQVFFEYNGIEYCYRALKGAKLQDISGVHFGACNSVTAGDGCLIRWDSSYTAAIWYAGGYSFSISMDTPDANAAAAMYELLS